MPHESDLWVGRELDGRWRVGQLLGEGGFSVVMDAEDLTRQTPVAVKILRIAATAEAKEELQGEISYLGDLERCDRVVNIKGHGEDVVVLSAPSPIGGTVEVPVSVLYVVLERADGCLAELLVALDQVSWVERLGLFRDVVKGVHQMHLKRIMSRDLKSENVLLFTKDFSSIAKVADLGRARRTSDAPRHSSEEYFVGRGDFRFAPPEVFWRQGVDDPAHWAAVDLFHLGSVLYELVLGHGITSIVLPNGRSILQATESLSPALRKAEYESNLSALRAQMSIAWEPFEAEVPTAIRPAITALLKQLTDPDPQRRAPRFLGRPVAHREGLEWLLRRSDILRRTFVNSDTEASRLAARRVRRSGAA